MDSGKSFSLSRNPRFAHGSVPAGRKPCRSSMTYIPPPCPFTKRPASASTSCDVKLMRVSLTSHTGMKRVLPGLLESQGDGAPLRSVLEGPFGDLEAQTEPPRSSPEERL